MSGSSARRGRIVGGVFLAMVVVAGGVGIALAGRGGGDEGVIEVVDTTVPDRSVDEGQDEAGTDAAAPAGPRDGLDSEGHPVTVEPSTDLTEGQTVAVSGSGFPGDTALGIVMCAGTGTGVGGVSNCDTGRFGSATTDASGAFSATFEVRRFIAPPALGFVDCFETACFVAAGALDDYDESGVAPVQFSGVEVLPPPPVLAASRTEGLLDGDELTVTVDGQPAIGEVPVMQCVAGREVNSCPQQYGGLMRSGPDPTQVVLRRFLLDADLRTWVDCAEAPGRCELRLMPSGDLTAMRAAPVPLTFDASVPAPPPAAVSVEPSTGLRHGHEVAIDVEGISPGYGGPLVVCLRDVVYACLDLVPTGEGWGGEYLLPRLVPSPADQRWHDCGADRCVVRASPWSGIRSSEVAISFDTSVPAPPPPALRLELMSSGDSLRLTGEGLLPGVALYAYAECETAWQPPRLLPGEDGTIDAVLTVPGDACPVGVSGTLTSAYWSPN